MPSHYDFIVIGAGPCGMMAAITAARSGKKVLLLEQLAQAGAKLKATGGGRCNLTNTLDIMTFMERFGREGRFMTQALDALDHTKLRDFFHEIGIETHIPDGFRVFPVTHNAQTIVEGLLKEIAHLSIELRCETKAQALLTQEDHIVGVKTQDASFLAPAVIIATGGLGYPTLGAQGDGYHFATDTGHTVTELFPAMMPLQTKETWVASCRADTIPKVTIKVDLPKFKKLRAQGDLIFTNNGIRGPVVLDFAREITPLLKKSNEVPILINLTQGKNEEEITRHFKNALQKNPHQNTLELLKTLLPEPLSQALCHLAGADESIGLNRLEGSVKAKLIALLAWTPLTITGHEGFKMAMITKGGVSLKEINPATMQSKRIKGLYFCGEVLNLDGPCGGYNLQWSFASGHLAGMLKD